MENDVLEQAAARSSLWKETAVTVTLLANCANLIGFVSTAWAVPTSREVDNDFEGLGLWKFCSYYQATVATCSDTVHLDMPGKRHTQGEEIPKHYSSYLTD